ncbi:hypothetical protein B0T19DRAFT_222706 [Cercophora scortea]|uniref:Uncharacterized protein n=1 Tax=Cercophora scortea TaxID=314031 RepID=A0AAE0IFQ1_9PEZI|nr:hypothetical protein B0T19DRAFT_222706 [Cercophora scortea]
MDYKKPLASLMEDDWISSVGRPSSAASAARPQSPFRRNGLLWSGDGGSALATSSRIPFDPHNKTTSPSSLSCVTRETSDEDCARHRFIVWAAVKRNSSSNMTPEDRLRCPLYNCPRQFQNHEAMLKHLAVCERLALGQYWCFNHSRVERFDDVKCKRCLGHPSKRRKMLSLAKNFFQSIGHKSKKGDHGDRFDVDNTSLLPPSYDSLGITPLNESNPTELSADEIMEIDSVEVTATRTTRTTQTTLTTAASPFDAVIDPQALHIPIMPLPFLPELDSTAMSNQAFMPWQPTSIHSAPPYAAAAGLEDSGGVSPSSKPSLQVDTHGLQGRRHAPRPALPVVPRSKGLSPSSSVRSNASTDTNATTASNVSSLISPASNWSGVWSVSGVNTNLTSPVDDFLTDNAFSEATANLCSSFDPHDFFSELPADFPQDATAPNSSEDMSTDPLFYMEIPTSNNVSLGNNITTEDSSNDLIDLNQLVVEQTDICCSEVKTMIGSSWDALQEHLLSSIVKIQHVRNNPLADHLRSMSTKTIAIAGLQTLRTLLDGGQPSSAVDTLCFVHLIYAFSLVVYEQEASHRSNDFYLQALTYTHSLQRQEQSWYSELVYVIWDPDLAQADINSYLGVTPASQMSRSSSLKGKSPQITTSDARDLDADSLLIAARNFLDELEGSLLLGHISASPEIQTCGLYTRHLQETNPGTSIHFAFPMTVKYVLDMLREEFAATENLAEKLNTIYPRVENGTISSVRRVEIEVLHAGKDCMPSATYFGNFSSRVKRLCDLIYEQHDREGTSRRGVYHDLGISLIQNIIPEFDTLTGTFSGDLPQEHEDLDELFFNKMADADGDNASNDPFADIKSPFNLLSPPSFSSTSIGLQVPTVITTPPEPSRSVSQTSSPANPDQNGQQPATAEGSNQDQSPSQQAEVPYSRCDLCDYQPKGDPQWFKGSMSKHKKLQHSQDPPKIYECPFPGCSSRYKNRPDNLRQHQIEKGHWVSGEESVAPRRPSKRKKVALDDE